MSAEAFVEAIQMLNAIGGWDYDEIFDGPEGAFGEVSKETLGAIRDVVARSAAARRVLGDFEAGAAAFLFEKLGYGSHELPGGAVTLRKGAARTAWDHDQLRPKVLVAVADELGVEVWAVEQVLNSFRKFTNQPAWSTVGLKAAGIDPDEYSKRTPGRPTVELL